MTSRAGDVEGCPRAANRSLNCSSAKTSPSASRIRMANEPWGNAARATRAVISGIS